MAKIHLALQIVLSARGGSGGDNHQGSVLEAWPFSAKYLCLLSVLWRTLESATVLHHISMERMGARNVF